MKGLMSLKRILVFFWAHFIAKPFKWLVLILHKLGGIKIIVWIYRPFRWITKFSNKAFLPGKSKFLTIFGNRYIVHAIIILAAVFIFGVNLKAQENDVQNFGKDSIMSNVVQEEFGQSTETVAVGKKISPATNYFKESMGPVFVEYIPEYVLEEEPMQAEPSLGGVALFSPEITSTERGARPRDAVEIYEVQPGDNIGMIADNFNITVNTILIENNLSFNSYIRPGDKLRILQTSGISYTIKKGDSLDKIAKKYSSTTDEIIEVNKLASKDDITVGQKITIPGGKVPATPTYTTYPYAKTQGNIPPSARGVAGKMVWPTSWKVITQYFGWRHTGLDIDGDYSSPIYAADAGYIERVGWGTGYGNMIIINHGNGVKTLYGHMSKFFVTKGQSVAKGQTLGMMGTTGRSTGTHLHFEVIISGKKMNPLSYIR